MTELNRIWWIGLGGAFFIAALIALFSTISRPPSSANSLKPEKPVAVPVEEPQGKPATRSIRLPATGRVTESVVPAPERPLSRTPNPSTERCLEALATSPLEADRVRAAMLLGRRADEERLAAEAVPALIDALENDRQPQVCLAAAQALGKYGAEAAEAVPALSTWFGHPTMRDVAIDTLGEIGPAAESAIAPIAEVWESRDERFLSRRKAIEALFNIGGPENPAVTAALRSAAADPDLRIKTVARSFSSEGWRALQRASREKPPALDELSPDSMVLPPVVIDPVNQPD